MCNLVTLLTRRSVMGLKERVKCTRICFVAQWCGGENNLTPVCRVDTTQPPRMQEDLGSPTCMSGSRLSARSAPGTPGSCVTFLGGGGHAAGTQPRGVQNAHGFKALSGQSITGNRTQGPKFPPSYCNPVCVFLTQVEFFQLRANMIPYLPPKQPEQEAAY